MDWNEDGLKDIIVGENAGTVRYYQNVGSVGNPLLSYVGYILMGGSVLDIGDYSTPFVDDWNEDGKKDLLVGALSGLVHLFINTGTNASPVFTSQQQVTLGAGGFLDAGARSAPVVADLNGDGINDLICGENSGYIYYFQNNGTNANPYLANSEALFNGPVQIDVTNTTRLATIDWNMDGELDLAVGNYDARIRLFLQNETTPPAPSITLATPGTIYLPASGGTVEFSVTLDNNYASILTCDVWTDIQLPDGSYLGPMVLRENVTMMPNSTIVRDLALQVPATAPSGNYYYNGYTGVNADLQVYSDSWIYFYKYPGEGLSGSSDWLITGWKKEETVKINQLIPHEVSITTHPNPFNPSTVISFQLSANSHVNLAVYDVSGRKVAQLVNGNREAGLHEVTFDASDLTSGVYIAKLCTGEIQQTQKVLLVR